MEKNIYPIRSFIRFQAKKQLLSEANLAEGLQASLPSTQPHPPQQAADDTFPDATSDAHAGALCLTTSPIDDDLLKEVATTLFNSDQHPELYRPCQDILEATAIEEAIAAKIVSTYSRIKRNEQRSEVQALNKLL